LRRTLVLKNEIDNRRRTTDNFRRTISNLQFATGNWYPATRPCSSKIPTVQVSDTTGDPQGTKAGYINKIQVEDSYLTSKKLVMCFLRGKSKLTKVIIGMVFEEYRQNISNAKGFIIPVDIGKRGIICIVQK